MQRFDYVQYDEQAQAVQSELKAQFQMLEVSVDKLLLSTRAKALVMTKLEEAYMWVGKGVRDDQIMRNGSAKLQEARTDS